MNNLKAINQENPGVDLDTGSEIQPVWERIPIIQKCADVFGTTPERIASKKRDGDIMFARHVSRKLYYKYIGSTMEMERLGFGDHATILNSFKVVRNMKETEKDFKAKYLLISRYVSNKINRYERKHKEVNTQ